MWVENNHLFAQIGNETMSLPFDENVPASVGDWHLAASPLLRCLCGNNGRPDHQPARLSLMVR